MKHIRHATQLVTPILITWLACGDRNVSAVEEAAADKRPLMVEARIKTGKPRAFETRLLAHIEGFTPDDSVQLDRYGGWIGEEHDATGFFYAKRIGRRWWLIDPLGHRFLHVAVNSVAPGRSPQMREALPQKFGNVERWRDETMALLRRHGFNGTGCWSDDELLATAAARPVYTPNLNFMSSYGNLRGGTVQLAGHKGYPNSCIFVFDPEFETFANRRAAALATRKDDPYLLGYFTDNELPFPRDLLENYLQLGADDPGRRAAEQWLAVRQGGPADASRITTDDREAWRGYVVDRYLGIVRRAIRRHDPNHMLLGPRFYGSEKGSPSVLRAAGKHLDVIALNVYGVWTPGAEMLGNWAAWSGRPVLVTEWYAKGDDSGLSNATGAGWTVATQRERGYFYQNFTLGLLESRACVGWHWFKYIDNDPTDMRTDPSNRNSNKGVVTVRYEPYRPLLDPMGELNGQAYPLSVYFDIAN